MKERIAGIIILLVVLCVVLWPSLLLTFVGCGFTLLLVWILGNIVSVLVVGKSLRRLFFDD